MAIISKIKPLVAEDALDTRLPLDMGQKEHTEHMRHMLEGSDFADLDALGFPEYQEGAHDDTDTVWGDNGKHCGEIVEYDRTSTTQEFDSYSEYDNYGASASYGMKKGDEFSYDGRRWRLISNGKRGFTNKWVIKEIASGKD